MRFEVFAGSSSIFLDDLGPIDRHLCERIDSHKHNAAIGVYFVLGIPLLDDMQDCSTRSIRVKRASAMADVRTGRLV